eukprot:scaffold134612_cov87-Phaeocystis_antarctica.AAC.1
MSLLHATCSHADTAQLSRRGSEPRTMRPGRTWRAATGDHRAGLSRSRHVRAVPTRALARVAARGWVP